ncbi:MAG: M42 family peptidase, partial [Clostridiales bacterium]|nr:M42 family peptidase [Clostridiales bacterium]
MIEQIKELCGINATSGREEKVRDYIISKIEGKCEYKIDRLGNLIAFKKGKNKSKNKIMLDAHMDEVGFIITGVTDKGYLTFQSVGGVDPAVIAGKSCVVGEKKANGVFGIKPIHLVDKNEENILPDIDKMYIDIGANSKEEALRTVAPGDAAYFSSEFVEMGEGFIKSKALDDRVGCSILIDMINSNTEYDLYFSFSTREEVGSGACVAAFNIKPDYALVLETTTAADIHPAKG